MFEKQYNWLLSHYPMVAFLDKETLQKEFNHEDIRETKSFQILEAIGRIYSEFAFSWKDPHTDKYKEPQERAKAVIQQLERLNDETASKIAKKLIEDGLYKLPIHLYDANKEQCKKWEGMEMIFNRMLGDRFQEIKKADDEFSVMEWATIFYYADPQGGKNMGEKITAFMEKHSVQTTVDNFRNKFYEARKRINSLNDYPIEKLDKIKPFLKSNYPNAVIKMQNDKEFLEKESADY